MEKIRQNCILLLLLCICSMDGIAQVTGDIRGKIIDKVSGQPLPGASISIEKSGSFIAAVADENGQYILKPLDPGIYTVKYSYIGYRTLIKENISVSAGKMTFIDIVMDNDNTLPQIEITRERKPLIDKGEISTVATIDATEIRQYPKMTVKELVATTPGVVQSDSGQDLFIRGSRSESTQYIVDGIKVSGSFRVPYNAIQEIKVITGGIPAQFGDATGGIVLITTKGYWTW